jgi:hypothetical protein
MITNNYGNENWDDRNYHFNTNAVMAKDLEDEFDHDDRDRRTLDESEADEDDSDDE